MFAFVFAGYRPRPVGERKRPRFFAIGPISIFLYATNEESDTIVVLRLNGGTERMHRTGRSDC